MGLIKQEKLGSMRTLRQIRIITKKDHQFYQEDFTQEPMSFQDYVNFELGQLFDMQHTIVSIEFIKKKTVVIVYTMKIK